MIIDSFAGGPTMSQLALFPDLLQEADPRNEQRDYLEKGFGIWTFERGRSVRFLDEQTTESRHLIVLFERDSYFTNGRRLRWSVQIAHYFNTHHKPSRGKSQMTQRVRYFERRFATRDEAIDCAERLLAGFERIRRKEPEPETGLEQLEDLAW